MSRESLRIVAEDVNIAHMTQVFAAAVRCHAQIASHRPEIGRSAAALH
jgi:hypothetical protein